MNTIHDTHVLEFSDSRETSPEISAAIFDVAESTPTSAQRLWEEPDDDQITQVLIIAWKLAPPDQDELCWGVTTFNRGGVT